jgi:hypothetical protein
MKNGAGWLARLRLIPLRLILKRAGSEHANEHKEAGQGRICHWHSSNEEITLLAQNPPATTAWPDR